MKTWFCRMKGLLMGIVVSLSLSMFADTQTVGDYTWRYSINDGKATIEEVVTYPFGALEIPSVLGNCPVVRIGEGAFYGFEELTSVTIPSSVTDIADSAFESCIKLREVTGGVNLKRVGYGAFSWTPFLYGVDSLDDDFEEPYEGLGFAKIGNFIVGHWGWLEEAWNDEYYDESGEWTWSYDLVIPEGTTGLADGIFEDLPITSVVIPGSVKRVPELAFGESECLQSLTIGEGVEEIGQEAFCCCGSLLSVTIPESMTDIEDYAFCDCYSLEQVMFEGGTDGICIGEGAFDGTPFLENLGEVPLLEIGYGEDFEEDGTVLGIFYGVSYSGEGCISCDGVLTIPEGVKAIADGALGGCEDFCKVVLPKSLVKIGEYAFEECVNLREVVGGGNLERVGRDAFYWTPFLYDVDSLDDFEETYEGLGFAKIGNFIVGRWGWLEEAWSDEWFDKNEEWTWHYDLVIPEGTTGLAAGIFEDLPITSVTIPGSVKHIPELAFAYNGELRSLTIGEGVEKIGQEAFGDCGSLRSVTIPASVVDIDSYAFGYCEELAQVEFQGTVRNIEIAPDAFEGTPYYDSLPETMILLIDDGFVYGIEYGVAYGGEGCISCDGVLTIPEGVKAIAEGALGGCEDFCKVVLPESLVEIGEYAFVDCINLREVEGGGNLERVGREAFGWTPFLYGVDSLDDFEEPYEGLGFAKIGNFIVGRWGWLEEAWNDEYYDYENDRWTWSYDLVLPEGTSGLADGIFESLPITSVTIPGSVKRIPDYAFTDCCYLRSLTIGEGVEEIGEGAFNCAGCEWGINRVALPSTLKSIESWAFAGFGYLKYVDGLEESAAVAEDAFEGTPYVDGWDSPWLYIEYGVVCGLEWEEGSHSDGCIVDGTLIIPEGVKAIGEWAFECCGDFTRVVLPTSLNEIGHEAFCDCEYLCEVSGGENLEHVGWYAFDYTPFLYGADSFEVFDPPYEGLGVAKIGNFIVGRWGYLEEAWSDEYYDAAGEWTWSYDLVIPEGTTGLADGIFSELPITSVSIPGSVKRIPQDAFGCCCLRTVTIGEGVEEIGSSAFGDCEELETLTIPESLACIDAYAFESCDSLTEIDIPAGVREIGPMAFYDDASLLTVTLHSDETAIDSSAFSMWNAETEEDVVSTNFPSIVCVKTGYTLAGWKRTATEFADKSQEGEFAAGDVAAAFSVFGEWYWDEESYEDEEIWNGYMVKPIMTANHYTVAFNANGGTGTMADQTFVYDVEQALRKNAFTRDGYTFAGWATSVAGAVVYADGAAVKNLTAEPNGSVALYALWTGNPVTITMPDGSTLETRVGDKLTLPGEVRKVGFKFTGWNVGGKVYHPGDQLPVLPAGLAIEPIYDLGTLYSQAPVVPEGETAPYTTTASVYDGYLRDISGNVTGIIQVKVAKGKVDKNTGAFAAKVTATVVPADGSKKISFKGGFVDEYGNVTGLKAGGRVLNISLGTDGLGGSLDGESIDGARNLFVAKDDAAKTLSTAVMRAWGGAMNVVADGVVLSVSIAKKGKVKVSGMVNGVKVSTTSQLLVGESSSCIPVVFTKKAKLAFTPWLMSDGSVEVAGLDGALAAKAEALKVGAKFTLGEGSTSVLPGLLDDYLPSGLAVAANGSKWVVAGGAKAGKLKLAKGTTTVDQEKSKFSDNMSGLKLSYKAKDGSFKGSFKAYAIENDKLKSYTVNVTGVMVGDVGYGTATIKKPSVSWPVTIE